MSERISIITPLPITSQSARLPRFRRVVRPPGMVLMERDKRILHEIYAFGRMTREQIERLLFQPDHGQDHPTKTNIARKRLRLLFHHGYLERIPAPAGKGTWAKRPVYRLSRKGAKFVAAELGTTLAYLDYWGKGDDNGHRSTDVSDLFLNHALAINDVRIAILQAAWPLGFVVEKWLGDSELKKQEMRDYVTLESEHGHDFRVAVIPDAYLALNLGEHRTHLFLEVDRATMSLKRWKARARAYLAYFESGKHRERYHILSVPRILTITTSPERLAHLKQATYTAGGKDQFWFATYADVITNNFLSSPIWRLANDERESARKSLVG